jgi:hypothetical protein
MACCGDAGRGAHARPAAGCRRSREGSAVVHARARRRRGGALVPHSGSNAGEAARRAKLGHLRSAAVEENAAKVGAGARQQRGQGLGGACSGRDGRLHGTGCHGAGADDGEARDAATAASAPGGMALQAR